MKRYVLDASALMTFFEDRPGAQKVEDLLAKAAETNRPLLMSVINWGEVYYSIWRARGQAAAEEKVRQIAQLPIELVEVDAATTLLAARLKAESGLPYVDAFAAALSQQRKATSVTADKDFQLVQKYVNVLWTNTD